ncbi:hypothetical protein [Streptomyces sp. Da 82-17]|uniref:hypothetical protein n=1 Tax=Streptomyces sp. Da 82-17 TaxID=3377116 RepID=UPI0038D43257
MAAAMLIVGGAAGGASANPVDRFIEAYPDSPWNSSGKGIFNTDGDRFYVKDAKADGYAVCIDVYATKVSTGKRGWFALCNSSGAGTVKEWNLDLKEMTLVDIRAFMLDDGVTDFGYGDWVSTYA